MLNPIKVIKKVLGRPSPAPTGEAAPFSETAAIGAYLDSYSKIISNTDSILQSKGANDFKIYQEVLRDDQVKSTLQQRFLSVVSKQWEVEAGADDEASKTAAEALKKNLQAINWDAITSQQLYAVFYGYGAGEVMWSANPTTGLTDIAAIKIRDRARFRFDVDGWLYLINKTFQYQKMPDRKFWVVSTGADNSDNYYGLGLAHWLYWPVFFKRNGIKFWLIFLEKFGQPTGVGKLPVGKENDKETRDKVLAALRAVATETGILLPDGAEITLLEATRSGAADYEAMKDAMDAAISKIVLSQTMTTDNGSSRSQSETHETVRDMVVAADADLICESFNTSVVQWWFEYNLPAFPGATRPRVYRKVKPEKDTHKLAERDVKIAQLGYEPTEEYIQETYGTGWVKKQAPAIQLPPPDQPPQQPANFAETALLDAMKLGHRADQQAIIDAAERLAGDYQGVVGARVNQILDYADTTKDYATMQARLEEMMAELPSQQTVEKIRNATFGSRLLGLLRMQK